MLEVIYSYVEKIVVFGIFVTIVSKILPNKNYGKYMKLYTGFLFLILLLFPLIRMTGIEQNFKNFYDSYDISLQYVRLNANFVPLIYFGLLCLPPDSMLDNVVLL